MGKSNNLSNVSWIRSVSYRFNKWYNINECKLGWLVIILWYCLFSGSLYFLALTQVRILGAITPIGGVLFIIGWLVLVIATLKFAG